MGRPLREHDVKTLESGQVVSRDFDLPVVKCRLCREVWTESCGTKLCDPCWELEHRVRHAPALALKILEALLGREVLENMMRREKT